MTEAHTYLFAFQEFIIHFAPKLIGALTVLVIGFWLTGWFSKLARRGMNKRGLDISLQSFLSSMVSVVFKIMILITVAGMLGIQTTSFVALIGAAGLAVGLALQGSLANFAGGVLTLVFKPYVVGDLIEAQGQVGEVKEIQIFNTILITSNNKTVILPNGAVSNGTIINHSRHGNLRIDLPLVLEGSADIEIVRALAMDILTESEFVLNEPAPSVAMMQFKEDNIELVIHCYVIPDNVWKSRYSIYEKLAIQFTQKGIKLASNQLVAVEKTK